MQYIATIRRRRRKCGAVEWIARLIYEEAETGGRKELSRSAPSPKEARRRLQELEDDFTERGVAAIGADQMKFSALVTHVKRNGIASRFTIARDANWPAFGEGKHSLAT